MTKSAFIASPLSKEAIENTAWEIRCSLGLENRKDFPVMKVMENVLPRFYGDDCYEILDDKDLLYCEGVTLTSIGKFKIMLPESVYEAACNDDGRARFTVAHELGHFFLHSPKSLALMRKDISVPIYRDPEWQANQFAGAILMPEKILRSQCDSISEVMKKFLVSKEAAAVRTKKLGIHIE